MFEKPTAQYTIGLETDSGRLKGALLTLKHNKPWIIQCFSTSLLSDEENQSTHHNLLWDVEPRLPRDLLRNALYATGLSAQETLIRQLDIKLTKEKDITAVLNFQAEPFVPYPIDQAILEKVMVSSDESGSQLTLFAVRKDHLQHHLDLYNDLNIEPESVGCYPQALARFAQEFTQIDGPLFVAHLATDSTTVLLVSKGVVLAGHGSNIGYAKVLSVLGQTGQDPSSVDFSSVTAESSPALFQALEPLKQELIRGIFALTKQTYGQEITGILVTGEGSAIPNLKNFLAKAINKTLIIPSAKQQQEISAETLCQYAVPIGLATQCLSEAGPRINFRQAEFSYPHPWKRLRKPLTVYGGLCLLLTALLFLLSAQAQKNSLVEARERYRNILAIVGQEHVAFEAKAFGMKAEEVIPIDSLTANEINNRIDWIEQGIKNTPYVFPLNPNTPRVSDVLAWICNSPQVVRTDPTTGERTSILQIENFNYVMVKRPDKSKPREHYQVKVDVEFSSTEPILARDFHDKLTMPNEFIDPRSEVKWSAAQGRYKASFYLKDKTYYP